MVKAVIFDVGGVLIRTEDYTPRRALEQRLGLARGESETLVFNSEAGRAAQMGRITATELWGQIRADLQLDEAGLTRFRQEFFGGDRLNDPLLAYIHTLRPHYQTAIISNFMDDLHHVLTDLYPIAPAFDLIVGSAYERVMKPEAAIYRRALERLGCTPSEAVFIDDFVENVAGAQAVGLHAVHFTPGTDVPNELARLGVEPAP